ncbi:MAG: PmoA family protein [Planctomycetaceae bacterium]
MKASPAPLRCELVPLTQQQVSFRIDGREVTRWDFDQSASKPCFFPLNGPDSGESLTRMGHPGAPNHDHHRSVWFAHHKLLGIDFWGIGSTTRIVQREWFVYEEGDAQARMAVLLDWLDGHDPQPLIEQELIATLSPLDEGEYTLDLQSTFRPRASEIEFQQTNFGFLAVRVARSISGHFGDGVITGASGETGEANLFGKANAWMDYSGPMRAQSPGDGTVTEGITYFDHPANPAYPAKWHVREDGWMGASACRDAPLITTPDKPLRLRYLLHVHRGSVDPIRAGTLAHTWAAQPWLRVAKSTRPHYQFELQAMNDENAAAS